MASSGSTWREHNFIVGESYIVTEQIAGRTKTNAKTTFSPAAVYQLQHIGYSHYDNTSVFLFRSSESDEPILWWWHDEEPDDQCIKYFYLVKNT